MSLEGIGLRGVEKILDPNGRLECNLYEDNGKVLGYKGDSVDLQVGGELWKIAQERGLYIRKSDFGRFFGGRG